MRSPGSRRSVPRRGRDGLSSSEAPALRNLPAFCSKLLRPHTDSAPMDTRNNGNHDFRILVVDDEPNIVDVISMALRYQGFEVASAATGGDALGQVKAFRPHLMVLDVMLPDMEGFDVAERLGAQRADVPIIFLTARDSTEDKLRGLTTGGDDYVTKPFSLEELVARIRVVLRRSGAASPCCGGRPAAGPPRPPRPPASRSRTSSSTRTRWRSCAAATRST